VGAQRGLREWEKFNRGLAILVLQKFLFAVISSFAGFLKHGIVFGEALDAESPMRNSLGIK
jgi:hypothetical protein